jgi:hypothetical protein
MLTPVVVVETGGNHYLDALACSLLPSLSKQPSCFVSLKSWSKWIQQVSYFINGLRLYTREETRARIHVCSWRSGAREPPCGSQTNNPTCWFTSRGLSPKYMDFINPNTPPNPCLCLRPIIPGIISSKNHVGKIEEKRYNMPWKTLSINPVVK